MPQPGKIPDRRGISNRSHTKNVLRKCPAPESRHNHVYSFIEYRQLLRIAYK